MESLNKHQTYYMTSIFTIDRLRMGTDRHGIITLGCFMGRPLRSELPSNKRTVT